MMQAGREEREVPVSSYGHSFVLEALVLQMVTVLSLNGAWDWGRRGRGVLGRRGGN